jgi:hypothetical protein
VLVAAAVEDDDGIVVEAATEVLKASEGNVVFEVEAKLITWKKANPEKKEEARWAEAGKGPLKIIADPGTKARLVMRTKIGRVILNCTMHVGMKVEKSGKSRIQTSLLGVGDPPVAELTG